MNYWITYTILLIIGLIMGIGSLVAVHHYRTGRWFSQALENVLLAGLAAFFALMATELFFAFFAQTDNLNFTLASKNWFKRYWSVNSLGYRDVEWTPEKVKDKRKIVILGDSFTAGYGIEYVEDRFANLLGEKLGRDYVVMIVAETGTETKNEIERIKAYPHKPDILILQYYINDIEDAARIKDVKFTPPKLYPPPLLRPLVKNSYSFNFFYWRTARLGPYRWTSSYLPWIKSVYNDPDIWWLHQQELLTIYQGTLSEKIKLEFIHNNN